jgi:hypothetical protein
MGSSNTFDYENTVSPKILVIDSKGFPLDKITYLVPRIRLEFLGGSDVFFFG